MKLRIACTGLLLCVGCTGGSLFSVPLSGYSDEELENLLVERYYDCARAAASGNQLRVNQAVDAYLDVYEEILSRPSISGDITDAEAQAMREYVDLLREQMREAEPFGR